MKGFITVLLCILCAYANAQALSDSLPTLDNLLELKWSQRGHRATSNPLVHDGLLFETFGISYAWDAESGQKLSFDRKEDQKRIRQLTSDSIICFSSPEGIAVVNIYSGKIIFRSKSKIKKPLIKKPRVVKGDKIYIATSDSSFSAISIIDGKTIRHFNSLRTKENPPTLFKEKSDFLKSMSDEQYNTFKKIIRSNVELVLFEFLKIFEENPQFKIIYEEDTRQVDLTKISEMLKAEPLSEDGWIARFSKEIEKDESQA